MTLEYRGREIIFNTLTRRFRLGMMQSASIEKIEKIIDREKRLVETSIPVLFEQRDSSLSTISDDKPEVLSGVVIGVVEAGRPHHRYTKARVRFRTGVSKKLVTEEMFWSCLYVDDSENNELLNEKIRLEAESDSLCERINAIEQKLRRIEEP